MKKSKKPLGTPKHKTLEIEQDREGEYLEIIKLSRNSKKKKKKKRNDKAL